VGPAGSEDQEQRQRRAGKATQHARERLTLVRLLHADWPGGGGCPRRTQEKDVSCGGGADDDDGGGDEDGEDGMRWTLDRCVMG